jgi:cellulase/cellobiase CelA1
MQTGGTMIVMQMVIYDLPNRDCHAKASNGEFTIANNGVANYQAYIDSISVVLSGKCSRIAEDIRLIPLSTP